MHLRPMKPGMLLATAAVAALAAGCGSSEPSTSSASADKTPAATAAPAADVLGPPKAAKGDPLAFGLLNLESGPVTFPEYRQAAEAAVKYVNAYKGGIGGRPVKLVTCATDGQPSTSARCAGQVLDSKPVAILGGADTGAPGAMKLYEQAKVAYLGGIPFTPVESNAPNAAIFIAVAGADVAAALVHVQKQGAKKLSIVYTDDTTGQAIGLGTVAVVGKQLGMDIKTIPLPPSASDLTAVAASAVSSQPDAVFLVSPNACPNLLKALKAVGNTATLLGIDVCVSPPALKAAGDAAEGCTSRSRSRHRVVATRTPSSFWPQSASTVKRASPSTRSRRRRSPRS